MIRTAAVLTAVLLIASTAQAEPKLKQSFAGSSAVAAQLRDKALDDPLAYDLVESLTTEVGPRLAGSPGARRATEWGVAKLKALGFANVQAEAYTTPVWARGAESAEITAPYPQKLVILGLGKSVPTPPGGIEAEAVVFPTLAELMAQPPGSLTGKIAVVTQKMTRTQDGSGYGAAVRARALGPSEAARRGAVAYLVRSISTRDDRLPHTGGALLPGRRPAHPRRGAVAVGRRPARAHGRARQAGPHPAEPGLHLGPGRRRVERGRRDPGPREARGDHRHRRPPRLLGSRPPAPIDDAAGIAITTAAAKLIGDLPRQPRRTIRVVMWGSEETGGAGEAYHEAHKAETANTVLAGESDLGGDNASGRCACPRARPRRRS